MNVEFDLKEILLKIDGKIDRLEGKVDRLTEDVSDIKTNLVRVEAELKDEIRVLDEKIDGINNSLGEKIDGIGKRVDTQEFINRDVIVGLLLAILGGFAKIFGFVS